VGEEPNIGRVAGDAPLVLHQASAAGFDRLLDLTCPFEAVYAMAKPVACFRVLWGRVSDLISGKAFAWRVSLQQ